MISGPETFGLPPMNSAWDRPSISVPSAVIAGSGSGSGCIRQVWRPMIVGGVPGITIDSSVDSLESIRNLIVLPGVRLASLIACRNEQSNGFALLEKQPP